MSVAVAKDEPRLITVALCYTGQPVAADKAISAAQEATQSGPVGKVQIKPSSSELQFCIKAEFFSDDEEGLLRVFGLYLAAIHDTYDRFINALAEGKADRIG